MKVATILLFEPNIKIDLAIDGIDAETASF